MRARLRDRKALVKDLFKSPQLGRRLRLIGGRQWEPRVPATRRASEVHFERSFGRCDCRGACIGGAVLRTSSRLAVAAVCALPLGCFWSRGAFGAAEGGRSLGCFMVKLTGGVADCRVDFPTNVAPVPCVGERGFGATAVFGNRLCCACSRAHSGLLALCKRRQRARPSTPALRACAQDERISGPFDFGAARLRSG
jgi:hypothetical protein